MDPRSNSSSAAKAVGSRQAQAETTQDRLLEATIDLLVEVGFFRASTPLIARRAGVSRGAQTHHFPTRAQLVTAAVERLADYRLAELQQAAEEMPDGVDRIPMAVDMLWNSFSGRFYKAVLELWIASRTDAELRQSVAAAERRIGRHLHTLCRRLFGDDVAAHPEFTARTQFLLSQLRGLALLDTFDDNPARRAEQWAFARPLLIELFTDVTKAPSA